MPLETHTVTLQTEYPGGEPLEGIWSTSVYAFPPLVKDTLDHNVIAGKDPEITEGGLAVLTLEETGQPNLIPLDFRWQISFVSKDRNVRLGPYVFELHDDMTLDQIVESSGVPVTSSILEQAVAAADAADADAVQTALDRAAVEAVGVTNDTIMASRLNDPASASRAAFNTLTAGKADQGYSGLYSAADASTVVPANRALVVLNYGTGSAAGGEVTAGDGVTQVKDLPRPVSRNMARNRRQSIKDRPRALGRVALPAGLGWSATLIPGLSVLFDGVKYSTTYDAARRKNTGGTTRYMSHLTGNDTTGDGSSGNPYATFSKCYTVSADGDTIVMQGAGVVYRSHLNAATMTKSLNIIAATPGALTLAAADNLTYTATSGQPNVWQSARTNVLRVVDILADPLGARYVLAASLAACNSTPGSYWTDATNVYVHTLDSQAPTSSRILALLAVDAPWTFSNSGRTSDMTLYMEGFTSLAGNSGLRVTGSNTYGVDFTAKDCKFAHGHLSSADGFQMVDCRSVVSQRVTVAHTGKDGFNYHSPVRTATPTQFLEIDCEAHSVGLDRGVDYSQNCTTAHDGVIGVRLNGKYHYALGTPLADVHTGTKTANYGCDAWDSIAPVGSGYRGALSAQQAGSELWFYGCRGWGTDSDLYCITGSTVHADATEYDTKAGAGTFDLVNIR